jgi:hypothetical protein
MSDPFLESWEWRTIRMRVLERDRAKCACCGKTAADGVVMNVDHIKPRKRAPELALTESNLQVLCNECNHGKGNQFDTDWRKPAVEWVRCVDSSGVCANTRCYKNEKCMYPATSSDEGRRAELAAVIAMAAGDSA